MVLDDASPQGGSFSGESASRGAPANTSTNGYPSNLMAGLRIKPETIVKPDLFTLYFGFFGRRSWESSAGARIFDRLQGSWVITGRTLTQDELDAFCTSTTQSLYYSRIGLPVSCLIGGVWEYKKTTIGVPGHTIRQRFSSVFHIAKTDPRHFWPVMANYGFRVFWVGSLGWMLTTIYSTWTSVSASITDPRLAQWREDTRHEKDEAIKKRRLEVANSMYRNIKLGHDVTEKFRRELSGEGGFEETPTPEQQYSYDAPADGQTYDSPTSEYQSPRPGYGSAPAQRPSQGTSSTDFFIGGQDDDASPTAAEYRNTNPDGSPMSSWDRIRAQNVPPQAKPSNRQSPTAGWGQTQNQSPPADPSPISAQDQYDVDKKREKEQAQANFDKMMDQERNGNEPTSRRGWGWGS